MDLFGRVRSAFGLTGRDKSILQDAQVSYPALPEHIPDPFPTEERAPKGARKPQPDAIVIGSLPLSLQIQRIGGSLRPVQVSSIIVEADAGNTQRLMDLANEARQKDCHLQSVLYTRETTLASLPWQLHPFSKDGKKIAAKDSTIASFVEDVLKSIYGSATNVANSPDATVGFRGLLAHLAGGCYYGFASAEVLWERQDGYLVPTGFSLLQPRRFVFRQSDGRLCWWDQSMPVPIDLMAQYPPGKFISHRPRINGDVPCREGLARPLMWAALFRNWDIRDWMALGELAWKPYRTGTYSRDATPNDIENLIEALRKVSTSGVAAFPETTKFNVEWPNHSVSSGQSMHGELANFFGAEMSKCVLGQTLTTEAGQKGARALGDIHNQIRHDIAEADAISAAATIQSQLIVPLVRLNFGPNANCPKFAFVTNQIEDIEKFSAGVVNLWTTGMEIPDDWVRDRVGMTEPSADDKVLPPPPTGGALPPPKTSDPNAKPTKSLDDILGLPR